jgi:UDP-N-acetyl-D-glucosamine dehydrogenase
MATRVVVVGQGYVGLPLAIRAAEVGHRVVGYDVDVNRIKSLVAGESYVEDIPTAQLAAALESGNYLPTADERDLSGFDVAVITVPTPLRKGIPDLSYVESASRALARYLRRGAAVVLESTTYPGTTEDLVRPLLEEGSGLTAGVDFLLGYSPERIDPGNQSWTISNTPKLVAGIDSAATDALVAFYGTLTSAPVPVSSPKVAELAKLIENTFRHVNIALVNEIAMYAHELDIDIWEAIDAASSKPFGFMRFTPGPGVGGHCLPVDPEYLSWRVHQTLGRRFRFIELGLAYKANTSDARESPALRVTELLLQFGAHVSAADPHVLEPTSVDKRVERVTFSREELAAADAVVILTDHDEFDYDLVREHSRYVLDCRRRLRAGDNVDVL